MSNRRTRHTRLFTDPSGVYVGGKGGGDPWGPTEVVVCDFRAMKGTLAITTVQFNTEPEKTLSENLFFWGPLLGGSPLICRDAGHLERETKELFIAQPFCVELDAVSP